jgi:arabinogalactan oligomer/maltooligosaccharide transport system permease protein
MHKTSFMKQAGLQLILLIFAIYALIPVMNIFRIAFDGSIKTAPVDFRLFPKDFSFDTLIRVWQKPSQDLNMWELLRNSLTVSGGAAVLSMGLGLGMAFSFARMRFSGREAGLFWILSGALLPQVALMTPLYILLSILGIRTTLFGLMLVYTTFAMPFCVWNMRAAFQAIPREIEEAAYLDGAGLFTTFSRIDLPLALPSIVVAGLVAFLTGYTEFAIGWFFVESSKNVTLAMALSGMVNYSGAIWTSMSALVLFTAAPVVIIFLSVQKWLIEQLTFGNA